MNNRSWGSYLKHEAEQDYFKRIIAAVQNDAKNHEIYPPHDKLFEAFKLTPFNEVKVVVLGQDPYHGPGQAHGLAFSVLPGVTIPPSLRNVYKELKDDLNIEPPPNGCLEGWAKQGVLLLNTSLTVRKGEPQSHAEFGWETFTGQIMSYLNQIERPIVFMLWGAQAKDKTKYISFTENKLVLQSAHPSPLAARHGFFGSKPFSKANKFLIDNDLYPIDWSK